MSANKKKLHHLENLASSFDEAFQVVAWKCVVRFDEGLDREIKAKASPWEETGKIMAPISLTATSAKE